jgi:hypothetical protein
MSAPPLASAGPEPRDSLLSLVGGPLVWAAHFLASYATAAVWCAKVIGRGAPLGGARLLIFGYTAAALLLIAASARRGWRSHRHGRGEPPHDEDTPEDRHRFLGFATLLLSGLSAIAVVYAALVVVFTESCW